MDKSRTPTPSVATREPRPESSTSAIIGQTVLDAVGRIPHARARKSPDPESQAGRLATRASMRAAVTAGSLALPTGPLGWLTLLPELRAVWKVQAQLVADIAALYGKTSQLTQEQVLYCMFRHSSAQVMQELVVQVGERFLVSRASAQALTLIARKLAGNLTRRVLGKGVSRWLPVAGAVGVGAFAYYETSRVAAAAMELFGGEVEMAPPALESAVRENRSGLLKP